MICWWQVMYFMFPWFSRRNLWTDQWQDTPTSVLRPSRIMWVYTRPGCFYNYYKNGIIVQERNIRSLESTLKHELLHAFGFSSSLFAFFRDETGEPRTPRLEDGKPPINLDLQVDEWDIHDLTTVLLRWDSGETPPSREWWGTGEWSLEWCRSQRIWWWHPE